MPEVYHPPEHQRIRLERIALSAFGLKRRCGQVVRSHRTYSRRPVLRGEEAGVVWKSYR